MIKGNSKVALFVSLLLLGFMLLIGSCVSKVEPTKEQIRIDSIQRADTLPSSLKGNKSK